MKAVFIRGKNNVALDEISVPNLGDRDVLVKMRACGLCGSDLEKVYGDYGMSSNRLGHEPTGDIINVGKSVKGFSIGDRVFVHHHVSCHTCHYCWHGDFTMCKMYQNSNIEPCGLSEQILVPEENVLRGGLVKLPENVTFDEASLIEPLACCIRGLSKCRLRKGDDIAILGAGPAGLMLAILAKLTGAGKIVAFDLNQFRLDFAKEHFGIDTYNVANEKDIIKKMQDITDCRGADTTIVATGNSRVIDQSFYLTRKGGNILLFGVPAEGTRVLCNISKLYSSELSIIPSYATSEIEINQAIRLISSKRIEIRSLITHRFDIANACEGIECARKAEDAIKVIVTAK
ncbi:MAG TPA: alcohol dehydrogenase catalytic domain-containing protein [Candidatus Nitrosopolaris sp.]|nr:alcohol dehydrogenase catalytic domain-containing protein [Candidatus Nitrosopolaris sp.]